MAHGIVPTIKNWFQTKYKIYFYLICNLRTHTFILFEKVINVTILRNYSNHPFIKIYSRSCHAFTKNVERHFSTKKTEQQAEQTLKHLVSILVFILILWFVYMLSYGKSKSITSYVLLSMNMMSTSNFESYDTKITMNAYKYDISIMSMIQFNSSFWILNIHCWTP